MCFVIFCRMLHLVSTNIQYSANAWVVSSPLIVLNVSGRVKMKIMVCVREFPLYLMFRSAIPFS